MASTLGSHGGTAFCDAQPAPRVPEVSARLESLAHVSERLMNQAVDLQKRLEPILGCDPPGDCTAKDQPAGCQLAGLIQSNVATLSNVEAILASIYRRLEL